MSKRKKFFSIVLIFFLAIGSFMIFQDVFAGGMSSVSVTLTDYTVSATPINTTIVFDPDGSVNSNDGIQINFQSDFDISSVVDGDISVTQTNSGTDITKGTASVSGQNLQIPITTESDTPSGQITIIITNNNIVNPTSSSTYLITISTYDLGADNAFGGSDGDADTLEDQGAAAIVIGSNLVTISGTVDPSLSLTLSGNTCALGTLSASNVQTCSYSTTVSTNATSGYTASIKDDGNLRNSTNDINDVSDGTVDYGNEEYGIATSASGQNILQLQDANTDTNYTDADCTALDGGTTAVNASGLTTSNQSFASTSAPVDSDVVYLCHSASVSGTTPAGAYSHIVTITAIGNF